MNTKRIALYLTLLFVGLLVVDAPQTQAQFGASDLVVTQMMTDPNQPEPDQRIELVAIIENTGRNNIIQGFNVRFKMNGLLLTDKRINFGLNAGEEEQLTFTWRADEGDHVFEVEVDVFKNVEETNEFNNKSQHQFSVRRPGAIRSVTGDLVESIGSSLKESGELLQIPFTPDLYMLATQFQKAFLASSNSFTAAKTKIENLVDPIPSSLRGERQIQTALRIAGIYESIASDFKLASDGINSFTVEQVPAAFQGIRSSMSIMADLQIEGVSYNRLRQTLDLLESGLELGEELATAFSGAQVNTTQITSDLVDVLHEIGEIWVQVSDETFQLVNELSPRHLSETGEELEALVIGSEIMITVPEASGLQLEIYSATGNMIYQNSAESGQLSWDGKDSQGNSLTSGRYYARLVITESDGTTRTDLSILTFS